MFVVDLCIRIHGYHQLNFHQPVHEHHPNGLCDSLRMGQMVSPKFILRAEFVSLENGFCPENAYLFKIFKNPKLPRGQNGHFSQISTKMELCLGMIVEKIMFSLNYLYWSI